MPAPHAVDEYISGFPPDVAVRMRRIHGVIVEAVAATSGAQPEEKIRYGIAAVMLGNRYALHYAAWKKHIGLYPVPVLPETLQDQIAPYRTEKDSVVFPHARPVPYELIRRVTEAIVTRRGTDPAV